VEGECTALQTAALPQLVLEAGWELGAWGWHCSLATQAGALLCFYLRGRTAKPGRELAHPRNEVWFLLQLIDFGQVGDDRGFGTNASRMKTEGMREVLHTHRCKRCRCSTGQEDPLLLGEIL